MSNPTGKGGFQDRPQDVNKGGRPRRGWTWAELVAEEAEKVLTSKDGTSMEAKIAIVKRLIRMAVEGDIAAMREIFNRMDGIPQMSIDHTTGGDKFTIDLDEIIRLSKTSTKARNGTRDTTEPKV